MKLADDMDAIMVAEDVQDSWTIEPNIDKDGIVEISTNCAVDVDANDALELSEVAVGKSLASRGLLFWEVYVDRGNISQYMVNHTPTWRWQIFLCQIGTSRRRRSGKDFWSSWTWRNRTSYGWPLHALCGRPCRT